MNVTYKSAKVFRRCMHREGEGVFSPEHTTLSLPRQLRHERVNFVAAPISAGSINYSRIKRTRRSK